MRFTLFILLILFTFTTKAESLCNYPITIGKNIFSLNQTTLEEIEKSMGLLKDLILENMEHKLFVIKIAKIFYYLDFMTEIKI